MDPWVIAVVVLFVLNAIGWVGVLVLAEEVKLHRRSREDEQERRYTAESARDKALQDVNKLQCKINAARQAMQ